MIDQPRSPISDKPGPYRSPHRHGTTTRNDDEDKQLSRGSVDVIAMVRSLQRTAGTADCFRQGNADCDVVDCDWRRFCLEKAADRPKNGKRPHSE